MKYYVSLTARSQKIILTSAQIRAYIPQSAAKSSTINPLSAHYQPTIWPLSAESDEGTIVAVPAARQQAICGPWLDVSRGFEGCFVHFSASFSFLFIRDFSGSSRLTSCLKKKRVLGPTPNLKLRIYFCANRVYIFPVPVCCILYTVYYTPYTYFVHGKSRWYGKSDPHIAKSVSLLLCQAIMQCGLVGCPACTRRGPNARTR
jgi:hypothetical protein